jgi:hypothetical protein
MWRTFLALNLMLCAFVPIPTARAQNCDPGDVGVMGFYPKLFEDVSYGCEEDILVDHLSGGAGRMEIAPSDVHISEHIVLGNNPPSLYTFLADLGDSRTVVFKSHGGPWGFMVMYFADAAARHTAYLSYPANWRGTYITEVDGAPAPGINFTWLGIGALIREASILKSKALVGAFHCNSIDLQANPRTSAILRVA